MMTTQYLLKEVNLKMTDSKGTSTNYLHYSFSNFHEIGSGSNAEMRRFKLFFKNYA